LLLGMGAAARLEAAHPAAQFRPPPDMQGRGILLPTSDFGVSIVRMPQSLRRVTSTPVVPALQQTPATPRPAEPPQPQGRLLKVLARLATQANDPQRAWLGA